ncbi:hypothetical protein ACR6HW_05040 [Fusibacter sp. JL298sf-3]
MNEERLRKYEEEKLRKREQTIKNAWKKLNEYGIYTEEELDEALKTAPKINIGCFVSPVRKK